MLKLTLGKAVAACLFFQVLSAHAKPLNVLVWDAYFSPADLPLNRPGMGTIGDEFDWDPSFSSRYSGKAIPQEHGKDVAYILLKDLPDVVLHRLHDDFFPWQDPEVCDLTKDTVLAEQLQESGYTALPKCREPMQKRLKELTAFLHQHDIKIVNMSHGSYFDRYIEHNPELLQARYPKVDPIVLHKFLYDNFLALAELAAPLFADNPDTLFVVAAGNNSANVDNEAYPFWDEHKSKKYFVPTLFGSFSEQFDNVVSVAATYDGQQCGEESNWGDKGVDFVKRVGSFAVPSKKDQSGWTMFSGTSSAAAETSRLYIRAYLAYGDELNLTPQLFKKMSRQVATPVEAFKDKTVSGGLLLDDVLLNELAKLAQRQKMKIHVIEKKAEFTEFHLPPDLHAANHQMGCHSLVVDGQDQIWFTLPWANLIVRFDPVSQVFTRYPLGEGVKTPDGISIDPQGRVWAGVDQPGGLVMIDPRKEMAQVQLVNAPKSFTGNITAVDPSGVVWASSHQARRVLRFDPRTNTFDALPVATDWPLDVRVDKTGTVWVAGMDNFNGDGGPGALIAIDSKTNEKNYIPIVGGDDRTVEWVAPAKDWIVMTSGKSGIYLLDRKTSMMTQLSREDGGQYYWIVRTPDENGSIFVLANDYKNSPSLDVLDVKQPQNIMSFALPTKGGAVREALGFDKAGGAWYCEYGTDVIGRLHLPQSIVGFRAFDSIQFSLPSLSQIDDTGRSF